VIDVAPTILEAAGLPEPNMVNGVPQIPMDGVSMVYTFDDADARNGTRPSTSRCSATGRSITRAGGPDDPQGAVGSRAAPRAGRGHLGSVRHDARTSAWPTTCPSEDPEKLAELQAMFMVEAGRNHASCRSTTVRSSA
jgi:arylsulfatase A-like enzyme